MSYELKEPYTPMENAVWTALLGVGPEVQSSSLSTTLMVKEPLKLKEVGDICNSNKKN